MLIKTDYFSGENEKFPGERIVLLRVRGEISFFDGVWKVRELDMEREEGAISRKKKERKKERKGKKARVKRFNCGGNVRRKRDHPLGIKAGAEVISGSRKTFNSFLIAYWSVL